MRGVLFDTSIYVETIRAGRADLLSLRNVPQGGPIWLSAVVLEELFAGAGQSQRLVLERFEDNFAAAKRILVPTSKDWTEAGKALALLAKAYGHERIGRGRLTNDALIAAAAGAASIEVLTTNARDFEKLAKFLPFSWRAATVHEFGRQSRI
jgi:predicted nucleic acid-binding protein